MANKTYTIKFSDIDETQTVSADNFFTKDSMIIFTVGFPSTENVAAFPVGRVEEITSA